MALLQVHSLQKTFTSYSWWGSRESFEAVKDVSFTINSGQSMGLLGSNGAGKTTTIQMLLGTLTPTAGTVTYFGKNLATHRSEILNQVTFASAYVKLPGKLTVWENLDVFARMYSVPSSEKFERISYFLKLFDMWHLRNKSTGELSAGQTTRVMLAKAFIPKPRIVLLDEPTASLDPDIAQEVRNFVIEQKNQAGLSILFTSHNMDEVTQVCDQVLVLQKGQIIAHDTPSQLAASVAKSRLELTVMQGLDQATQILNDLTKNYTVQANQLSFEIDEHEIASVLSRFALALVSYSAISITKPTLEDYFMSIAKKARLS